MTINPQKKFEPPENELRRKFDSFIEEARSNERKLRRFQAFELRLVSLNSVFELLQAVVRPDSFNWDAVTLLLVDQEYEIRRNLEEEGVKLAEYPSLIFASSFEELIELYPYSLFPTLSPYKAAKHSGLFPKINCRLGSVALLPLVRYGKLIGSLNIGSTENERFVKGVRTDFFEHLAAIVAICLENAVNLQRLKRQGLTDTLTAINNRRFFEQRLREEVEFAQRNRVPLSCMLLDVDFFKRVNDTYGHQAGDHVLREVAALIRAQLRGSDVLSRYGGEEFAALLSQTSGDKAEEVAERVRRAIDEHPFTLPGGEQFNVTISIGIATYNAAVGENNIKIRGDALIGHADQCLYSAKASGRNKVVSLGDIPLQDLVP